MEETIGRSTDSGEKNPGGVGGMNGLHDALGNMMRCAYDLQQTCDEILKQCYQDEEITFPVDIKKVAKAQGIGLEYENLNLGGEEEIDLNIAQLRYEMGKDGKVVKTIYVDNSKDESYYPVDAPEPYSNLQKYAIAYELGKTIVQKAGSIDITDMSAEDTRRENRRSVPYSLPKLYARQESFEYEMCAIFLLLPMDLFYEEFDSYLASRTVSPVYMEKWIRHLSEKTQIPNYQLVNGYQYIKFCAYQYYQEWKKGRNKGNAYWQLYQ